MPKIQDKTGKYLIEKHTILTAPSIQVLELNHQKRQHAITIVLSLQSAMPLATSFAGIALVILFFEPQLCDAEGDQLLISFNTFCNQFFW